MALLVLILCNDRTRFCCGLFALHSLAPTPCTPFSVPHSLAPILCTPFSWNHPCTHRHRLVTWIVQSRNFSLSGIPQVDCSLILCPFVPCSWDQGRNMVKASGFCVCLVSGLSLKLHWCRLFFFPICCCCCSHEMVTEELALPLPMERRQQWPAEVSYRWCPCNRNGSVRSHMEGAVPSEAVEKRGEWYIENLLGFLKQYWQQVSASVCGINVKLDGCCLNCVLSPGKVTHRILKFWEAETHGLCQQRKANQLKLFTLVLPYCSLPGSLRKRSSRRHRWTDTEESLRVCKTLQLPVNPKRFVKENQGKPQESSCCVSVRTEESWWHCESDHECKAGDGRKPSPKMPSLAIYEAFGEPFQLGQTHMKMLTVAVIFQAEVLRKLSWKSRERIWMDERDGSCLCCPLLLMLEVLQTTELSWLLIYFWGNCPVPRSEPSPQTAFPQLLGVRKSTAREKTKALSAWKNRASQLGISRQRSRLIVLQSL